MRYRIILAFVVIAIIAIMLSGQKKNLPTHDNPNSSSAFLAEIGAEPEANHCESPNDCAIMSLDPCHINIAVNRAYQYKIHPKHAPDESQCASHAPETRVNVRCVEGFCTFMHPKGSQF